MPEARSDAPNDVSAYFDANPLDDVVTPDVGSDFHEATKLHPALSHYIAGPALQFWTAGYASVPRQGVATRRWYSKAVPLPEPMPVTRSLSSVVAGRASTSPPGDAALTTTELATVLALAYGATLAPGDPRVHRRPVPSGGAMYPLDLYVGVGPGGVAAPGDSVELGSGLYHFDPFRHSLELLRGPAAWEQVAAASQSPEVTHASSVILLLVACFARQTSKYGVRGYRFAYLEAGHVGQNISLAAEGLGLGCLPFGSLYDAAVEEALGLDGVHESLVHSVLLGR